MKIIIGEAATQDEAKEAREKLEGGVTAPSQITGQRIGESASEFRYRRAQEAKLKAEKEKAQAK
jgi:hypothetical protein